MDIQPFSIVEDPGFLSYSYAMDPHFKVGSRNYYRDLLDKVYENGMIKIKEKIKNDDPPCVSVQLDGWSSNQHGYFGLIVNYITASWKRVNLVLACSPFDERHTSENIANWLEGRLEDVKCLDRTTVIVSDSAANMLHLMDFLPDDIQHNKCLNHLFNTVVENEIFQKPEIEKLVANVRAVTNYSHNSNLFANAMRQECLKQGFEVKSLIQDVKTRWNSVDMMIERFCDMENIVKEVLEKDGWSEKIKKGARIRFSVSDWKLLKNIHKVLEPFKDATNRLSGASACISEYIPTVTCLLKSLEINNISDEGVKGLKKRLVENLTSRTAYIEETETYFLATILDARFKDKFFRSNEKKERAIDILIYKLKRESETNESVDKIPDEISMPVEESSLNSLERIFASVKETANNKISFNSEGSVEEIVKSYLSKLEDSNLKWWSQFQDKSKDCVSSHALFSLARKYLTPPPTSTCVERVFSSAGLIADNRPRLQPDTLEKLLFVRDNLLMKNINLQW